jgi:hypothetical protein
MCRMALLYEPTVKSTRGNLRSPNGSLRLRVVSQSLRMKEDEAYRLPPLLKYIGGSVSRIDYR